MLKVDGYGALREGSMFFLGLDLLCSTCNKEEIIVVHTLTVHPLGSRFHAVSLLSSLLCETTEALQTEDGSVIETELAGASRTPPTEPRWPVIQRLSSLLDLQNFASPEAKVLFSREPVWCC